MGRKNSFKPQSERKGRFRNEWKNELEDSIAVARHEAYSGVSRPDDSAYIHTDYSKSILSLLLLRLQENRIEQRGIRISRALTNPLQEVKISNNEYSTQAQKLFEAPHIDLTALFSICVKHIAQNIDSYSPEDLEDIFVNYLPSQATELFSIELSRLHRHSNIFAKCFRNKAVTTLIISGSEFTDEGLQFFFPRFDSLAEVIDNWEDSINASSTTESTSTSSENYFNLTGCFSLQKITFMQCKISLSGLESLQKNIPNLEYIHLFDISSSSLSSPSCALNNSTNLDILHILTSFTALKCIEISYCKWMSVPMITRWLRILQEIRNNTHASLLPLKDIFIRGLPQIVIDGEDMNDIKNNFFVLCNIKLHLGL